jgi:hypothetical protein
MDIDTVLKVLGLSLSLAGLFIAGLSRQKIFAIFAAFLVLITGVTVSRKLEHNRTIRRTETQLKDRLSNNRWTFDDIRSEMPALDPKLLQEAIDDAMENGSIKEDPVWCQTVDGSSLRTRVYFNAQNP